MGVLNTKDYIIKRLNIYHHYHHHSNSSNKTKQSRNEYLTIILRGKNFQNPQKIEKKTQ